MSPFRSHIESSAGGASLSIWMQINADQRYATDFDDLAFFTAQYRRLMADHAFAAIAP